MSAREFLSEIYRRDRVLAVVGWLHLVALVVLLCVAPFDTRTIMGLNPWIKPMKFCVSIAIYLWTLAWFLGYLRAHPRPVRLVSWGTAFVFVVEMACIISQAARGTTSHYNVATPYDAAIFSTMGAMIALNTLLAAIALAFFFRRTTPQLAPAYLWGIRLGLLIFILASLEGMAMIMQSAHTVGAPDGGPGLPLVNWSTRAGDLRVAHFLGFHALQLLPLAGYGLSRWPRAGTRARQVACVWGLALIYMLFAGFLFWQAMRGRPLINL
ncbi:MAG: hypothetical protein H7Z38_20750 [Rubrivivax sp.]|nr:hypothetical protein [Pyrinomonadaceae bacterium]